MSMFYTQTKIGDKLRKINAFSCLSSSEILKNDTYWHFWKAVFYTQTYVNRLSNVHL